MRIFGLHVSSASSIEKEREHNAMVSRQLDAQLREVKHAENISDIKHAKNMSEIAEARLSHDNECLKKDIQRLKWGLGLTYTGLVSVFGWLLQNGLWSKVVRPILFPQ